MSITTSVKTVLGAAIASLTLLTLVASPSLADTQQKTVTSTTASSSINEAQLTQQETSQAIVQTNQKPQQQNKMECSCCKNMMNNMPGMMNNMPGMMNNMPGMGNQNR